MPERHLHIISFDVPYPPNYGGVIDVYYKIRALRQAGIKIHLHCFHYGRPPAPVLEELCEEVRYYPRKTGVLSALGYRPYIVQSRRSDELITRLQQDDFPILFEGLHTCYYLNHPALKGRKKIYRESNIEHHYYFHLFRSEPSLPKRLYFLSASVKLFLYQRILRHATLMLVVSASDMEYLRKRFSSQRIFHLPSFHPNEEITIIPGQSDYALYHGNLSVSENYKAAVFLITKVFRGLPHRLVIAGLNPPARLIRLVNRFPNVSLISNPDDHALSELIHNAHINVLVTFQATGLKLKLLNTLFRGRFCLVNTAMIQGTGLEELCVIADSVKELREKVSELFCQSFSPDHLEKRREILLQNYSNEHNCRRLISLIFGSEQNNIL